MQEILANLQASALQSHAQYMEYKKIKTHLEFMLRKHAEAIKQAESDPILGDWLKKQSNPKTSLEWDEWRIAMLKFQCRSEDARMAIDYLVSVLRTTTTCGFRLANDNHKLAIEKLRECKRLAELFDFGLGLQSTTEILTIIRKKEILEPLECAELANIILWMGESLTRQMRTIIAEEEVSKKTEKLRREKPEKPRLRKKRQIEKP